ncbi:MAG: amidohydrolase family protein [Actinobacteria bacterium]|jgi:predicted TIM-barrel fold metal-dependent hydrolase|nr:amidohydrolase family protein [Actinomycetota bacterium]
MLMDPSAHPTCDGLWIGGRPGMTHAEVMDDLDANGVLTALAVGLPGVGGYEHERFLELTMEHPRLVPVAALTVVDGRPSVERDLDEIARLGYRLVKIHPRLLGYERTLAQLPYLLGECIERRLAVLLCTYPEYRSQVSARSARAVMASALAHHSEGHFMTLHTGVLDPEPFAAVAAGSERMLLDFSLSLLKYPDEVWPHLMRLIERMPRSLCLGSDGPEWTYRQVHATLDQLAERTSPGAAEALGGSNLVRWLANVDADLVPRVIRDL